MAIVTGTLTDWLVVELEMVTVPVYVPEARLPGFAVRVTMPAAFGVAVPDWGAALSQLPPLDVDTLVENASDPVPVLRTRNCCVRVLVGFLGKVNVTVELSRASCGLVPAPTLKVTLRFVSTGAPLRAP